MEWHIRENNFHQFQSRTCPKPKENRNEGDEQVLTVFSGEFSLLDAIRSGISKLKVQNDSYSHSKSRTV